MVQPQIIKKKKKKKKSKSSRKDNEGMLPKANIQSYKDLKNSL